MMPGTPLISTHKTGDIIHQILVIFDHYEDDGQGLATIYDPRSRSLERGNILGLMQLDGRWYDPYSIVVTNWEETILDYVRVTENYCVLFRPSPELERFVLSRDVIAHHVQRAIDAYRSYKSTPRII